MAWPSTKAVSMVLRCLPLSFLFVFVADGASILGFFPFPGTSHHHLFGPLMEGLAARGHRVLYVTPIKWKSTTPGLQHLMVTDHGPQILGTLDFIELGEMNMASHSKKIYDLVYLLLEHVLQEEGIQKLIHSNETFDAVILESYFFQEANSALIHKFGAAGIEFVPLADSAWVGELTGHPFSFSYMMDFKSILTDRMSLTDKLYNMYVGYASVFTSYFYLSRMQVLMDKYYNYTGWESRPPLAQMVSNRSVVLVNKDPLLAYPFPTPPHVKEVAGLSIHPVRPLPQDMKKFMDSADKGVIYMSLGLNLIASHVLKDTFKTFLKVFKELEQNVMVKWETDYGEELPPNVMVKKKFPQPDILSHRKCILFITHGGYMSLAETVHHGVPIVGIPFYGDQPKNILWAQEVGIGVNLAFRNLSYTSIKWAIEEALGNHRYTKNMAQRSRMYKDRRHSPLDESIFWIEHAIKYPNALTPASAHMSFIELHMIDVGLVILMVIGVVATVLWFVCSLVFKVHDSSEKKKVKAQ